MNERPTLALIVAAGRGSRAGEGVPKQYRPLGGIPVLRRTVLAFQRHPAVGAVRVVIHPDDEALYRDAVGDLSLPPPIVGGETRQQSVANGLAAAGAELTSHHGLRNMSQQALTGEPQADNSECEEGDVRRGRNRQCWAEKARRLGL